MSSSNSEALEAPDDDRLPEYDFTGGVRGKHYQAYRTGHTVTINQTDGMMIEQHFTLEDGAVMLDPEVRRYFPDSEAVNNALRMLISLIPREQPATTPD